MCSSIWDQPTYRPISVLTAILKNTICPFYSTRPFASVNRHAIFERDAMTVIYCYCRVPKIIQPP